MNISGNTVLITGGGSGIGLALAEELLKNDNQVIVAGRSSKKLEAAAKKGLKTLTVDMTDTKSIEAFAKKALQEHPTLNGVILNAGIMKNENYLKGRTQQVREETIATNLLAPMTLTELLLPNLLKQKSAFVMTVTSGLAYAPLAMTPTYCATKAAIHSYTQSLRYQLKDTCIQVIELVPPYVQTTLMGERQASDPNAMPLHDFISEVLSILKSQPNVREVLVQRVQAQRFSGSNGEEKYVEFLSQFNDRMLAARKSEW